jgi:hypothetical protein
VDTVHEDAEDMPFRPLYTPSRLSKKVYLKLIKFLFVDFENIKNMGYGNFRLAYITILTT